MEAIIPLFKIGDVIKQKKHPTFKYTILDIINDNYITNYSQIHLSQQNGYVLDTTFTHLKEADKKMEESITKSDKEDMVNHPKHYTWLKELCGIEVIDIIRHMDFDLGSAIKYILRHGRKSEKGMTDKEKAIEDLKKAIFYINDKIKMLEKDHV